MNRDEALREVAKRDWWPEPGRYPTYETPDEWDWVIQFGENVMVHSIHDPIKIDDWAKVKGIFFVPTPIAEPMRLTAPDFLERGAQHMRDRAAQRDKPDGERSMARAVAAFNAQEGTSLTEEQGWRFMVQLKYSRACAGVFVADDYEDMAAYAGLAGEAAQ